MKISKAIAAVLVGGLVLAAPVGAQAPAPVAAEVLHATVNGKPITLRDFQAAYANHVRSQFYHREGIAEERLLAARQEVSDRLVERILLLEEVDRRKVEPDMAKVEEAIAGYEKRYAASPMWQQNRATLLPGLKDRLAEQSRLERLEQQVRALPAPSEAEVRAYYDAKPELFTEPEKLRLRSILLKVDPSAPVSAWDAARQEAVAMVKQLQDGADFAEMAKLRSQDKSASAGGDMGYLHLGMLPEPLQARIDKLVIGQVGDPVDVLEGIGVFRLDERVVARHRDFAEVAERARDLLLREKAQQAWRDFLAGLRSKADVRVLDAPATPR